MKTEVIKNRFTFPRKTRTRLLQWFVLIVIMALVLFIILGYFAALKPVSYLPVIHSENLGSYSNGKNIS